MSGQMNIDDIMQRLPHRFPFLLVDKVLDFEVERSIRAIKNVTYNEPQFMGHFPDHPVMPGVMIVEAMAQVGGILAFQSVPKDREYLVYFTGIDKVRFRRPVRPGDQIVFDLSLLRHRGLVWKFNGKATVDGQLVCEGELMATLMPRDEV